MGAPISLLQQARAFARDFPRDSMPKGYLWDVVDFVPSIIDAELTGRGGWAWGSDPLGGDAETGILATFIEGDQLLVQTSAGELLQLDPNLPNATVADRGPIARGIQNPLMRNDETIWLDGSGATVPTIVRPSSMPPADASAPKAKVGTVWGSYLVLGGVPGFEDTLYFSHPTNDLTTPGGWDADSVLGVAGRITALAALRGVIIVFHPSSTERVRGSVPPNSTQQTDDLFRETLFSSTGCSEPKSISYWNENVVFADEHGVHITDGAVIRNLISQGGIRSFWRPLWATRTSVAATTFLDYYQITLGQPGGPVTLVCDMNQRQWFRFTNVNASSYIESGGSAGMERIWAGITGAGRLARIGPIFFPTPGGVVADADGTNVLPEFETPWYRLAQEGRKRVRFAYLSYDIRGAGGDALELGYMRGPQNPSYTIMGQLPFTGDYSRFRLPVGQFPYGVAFRVRQTQPSNVTRVFDFALEAQAAERSRV